MHRGWRQLPASTRQLQLCSYPDVDAAKKFVKWLWIEAEAVPGLAAWVKGPEPRPLPRRTTAAKLESPLRQEHGLTLFEYLVLSHLSEAPQRKLRMGELAFLAELADVGFDLVQLAAPTHVRAVRRIVLDSLNTPDQKALVRIAQKLRIIPDDFG
ncbi:MULTISPECIES: hypothetical protein [unclassified Kribbella]|uniref:hypothetical protein n=1 Tax=unclassified Kribbella TaxID=2644121 RepID=UPI003401AC22